MKRILIIGGVLAGIGVITGVLVYFFVINKPHRDIEAAKPDYTLQASQLFQQLEANKQATDSLYFGNDILAISGELTSKKAMGDSIFVLELTAQGGGDNIVNVQLHQKYANTPNYKTAFDNLSEGQSVTVKGVYTGSVLEDLMIIQAYKVSLNNAFIIEKAK